MRPGSSSTITLNFVRTNFTHPLTLSLSGAPSGVSGTFSSATVSDSSASLTLNVAGSAVAGNYGLTITASGGGKTRTATLSLQIANANATRPSLSGTLVLACYYLGNDCDQIRSRVIAIQSNVSSTTYRFRDLEAGRYLLLAWKDSNQNEELDSGDWLGIYTENGDLVLVEPPRSELSFSVELVQDLGVAQGVSPQILRFFERASR